MPTARRAEAAAATVAARHTCRPQWRACSAAIAFSIILPALPGLMARACAADGQAVAANGNGRDAPACSACHGEHGEGQPDAAYPRLADLDSGYLIGQLDAFAQGSRDNETMGPIAKALSPDERQAVATFYAGLDAAKIQEPKKLDEKAVASGDLWLTAATGRRNYRGVVHVTVPPGRASGRRSPNWQVNLPNI